MSAENRATDLQRSIYDQNVARLQPFVSSGQSDLGPLSSQYLNTTNALGTAFNNAQAAVPQPMTQANLVTTPGYQFALDQGQRSLNSSAAARGLGVSGAALSSGANLGTQLANQTYAQQLQNQLGIFGAQSTQFGNQLAAQSQIYNQLYGPASLAENAAAQTGSQGVQSGTSIANTTVGAGQAQAAGITAGTNALTAGLNNAGQAPITYLALSKFLSSGNGPTGGAS